MTGITSHVLDTSQGRPAAGVAIGITHSVAVVGSSRPEWAVVGEFVTDSDGRIAYQPPKLATGTYTLRFEIEEYLRRCDAPVFYPFVDIVFRVENAEEHYHVPLLLSPFGYSTYRGS